VPNVTKSGNLKLLEPSGPHRASCETPLLFTLLDAECVMIFIVKLTKITITSITVLNETEKGRTDKQKQFVNKVLKTRYIGFAPSGRHLHGHITVGYTVFGELFRC
jgi:hypothetical protein